MRNKNGAIRSNGECRFPYFLVGLDLRAIGGLISALLGRKETRGMLRKSQHERKFINDFESLPFAQVLEG